MRKEAANEHHCVMVIVGCTTPFATQNMAEVYQRLKVGCARNHLRMLRGQ
jgi:hypothetical protein